MSNYPQIITKKQLRDRIPYSDTQIWRLERAGKFPRRVKLGPNRVGWVAKEIDGWIDQKLAERGND